MIRKIALQAGFAALFALIGWNGYLAGMHVKRMQRLAALSLQSSTIAARISAVRDDLTGMETGQRGYLLTNNPSYLRPYTEAKNRIASDFSGLRTGLADRGQSQRSIEVELESVANSLQSEMERTIDLRTQGYRHRAFKLVDSNQGMDYMDRARELLASLSASESGSFARFDNERNGGLSRALKETVAVNLGLLALTAGLYWLARRHGQVLEQAAARSGRELEVRDLQLSKLTSALTNQARSKTSMIEANVRLLLQNYGDFLPRQGHLYAEQIEEASAQMEQLRQDLLGGQESSSDEQAPYAAVA
jgi:CHASE3 domain sensor protein